MLVRAGFEPLPTREGCFTLKSLSSTEVMEAAARLVGLGGLLVYVEGIDDSEESQGCLTVSVSDGFPPWARLPEGVGFNLTVFEGEGRP